MKGFKYHSFIKFILTIITLFLITKSYAERNYPELVIVNHFDNNLSFNIGINPHVLPGLSVNFVLKKNYAVISEVLDIQKEAYIRVKDGNDNSAFWGVAVVNGNTKIYGYISKGIAFSWVNQTITFCTPQEYKQKRSCN